MIEILNQKNGNWVSAIEEPKKRTIFINESLDSFDQKYFLSMPHIVYSIHPIIRNEHFYIRGLKISFVSSKKFKKVYLPSLLNADLRHNVCIKVSDIVNKSLEGLIQDTISKFWSTSFNHGLASSHYCYNTKLIGNFKKWEKKTLRNPEWFPKNSHFVRPKNLNDLF